MPSIEESAGTTPLADSLQAGIANISYNGEIIFTPYLRLILPLDQFAFWVRADLLSESAAYNTGAYNRFLYNQGPRVEDRATPLRVKGSLHISTDLVQAEDETIGNNHVIFTCTQSVRDLDEINPNMMYIGEFQGERFTFSKQGNFFGPANVWHYRGDAINGPMRAQVIDNPAAFDAVNVITSNSLAIWLTLDAIMPIYPSFLVPANIVPPYAAVHIDPARTEAIQSAPSFDLDGNHFQLVKDTVKFTIYGLRNFNALDFQDYIFQYSLDTDNIGIMNTPVIRDEKRTDAELMVIAMKKTFELEVNYYQARINNIARQYIRRCIPSYIIMDL